MCRRDGIHAIVFMCLLAFCAGVIGAPKPENLARKAKATATSEYNKSYVAQLACDGKVPKALGKADVGKAWVVKGNQHLDAVTASARSGCASRTRT